MLETIVKDQAGEQNRNESSNVKQELEVARRDFLLHAMAAASGLALSSLLPPFAREAWAQAGPCPPGQSLEPIMEITSSSATKTLQAVLKILDEKKTYLAPPPDGTAGKCLPSSGQMRYFSGFDATNPSKIWPTTMGVPRPGPTLRARVGDRVQITLLNQHYHSNPLAFRARLRTSTAFARAWAAPSARTWLT